MESKEPLKAIFASTRSIWDRSETRKSVRINFSKVLNCRTTALGSEVYASENEHKVVPHTCKSRACPSCGHRATTLWQRELWTSLPDIPYAGIVFTMPDVLWPIFRENRHLLHDLPALGASFIQRWAKEIHRVSLMIMVVPHTFGRHLNFNAHLHILVSAAGLREIDSKWISSVLFDQKALMKRWRYAVITYIRTALIRGLIREHTEGLRDTLTTQYERWWNIHVHRCTSKEHFLRYAARYVRRPPLAQYRFVKNDNREIQFRTKDHKLKREVITKFSPEDFVRALADHVPDHYKHAIRYFGLLAPRSKGRTSAAVFTLLGQEKRPRPSRLSWAHSIKRAFGVDPLRDSTGQPMRLVARRVPYQPRPV